MADADTKLTRIGVFYDGNFFFHVSNYYAYQHERRARLGIHGLHDFIRTEVARHEGVDPRYCQIVDVHYFRGRLSAREAENRALLLKERLFDDVLINEGVVTHYLPLTADGEKGGCPACRGTSRRRSRCVGQAVTRIAASSVGDGTVVQARSCSIATASFATAHRYDGNAHRGAAS